MKSLFIVLGILLAGCSSGPTATAWEDTKTLGRYVSRSTRHLMGKETESRLLDDSDQLVGPEEEFIPLSGGDLLVQAEKSAPQPKERPVPGIELFKEPSSRLATIFRLVHFDTDKHIFTNNEYSDIVHKVSGYLKQHPETHVFVLGHCDERASSAYNLALGTRRANYVRNMLLREGVHPSQVYAISMGKETPLDLTHTRSAWAKNRRVEFKLYEAKTP